MLWTRPVAGRVHLADALAILGELEGGTSSLEKAIEAYRAVLEERTEERAPLGRAFTMNHLGAALMALGTRSASRELLEEAREAVAASWKLYEREGLDHHEHTIQKMLREIDAQLARLSATN